MKTGILQFILLMALNFASPAQASSDCSDFLLSFQKDVSEVNVGRIEVVQDVLRKYLKFYQQMHYELRHQGREFSVSEIRFLDTVIADLVITLQIRKLTFLEFMAHEILYESSLQFFNQGNSNLMDFYQAKNLAFQKITDLEAL